MKPVRKAVFPVAGLGTRFLPATKAMPKEMLPVVDKPLIQYAVEEAAAAGITDMIFITGRYKRAIEDHFDKSPELEADLTAKGKYELLDLVHSVTPRGVNFIFIRQPEPLGLGHAVLCARPVVGDEPFGVILADDLIYAQQPALGQLIGARSEMGGGSVLAVQNVAPKETNKYGIVGVDDELKQTSCVRTMVEKPAPEAAPSTLAVIGRYVDGAVDVIYRTMAECGLTHDEGPDVGGPVAPYIQSQRRDTYGKYARLLVEKGGAYYCFCEKTESEEDSGEFDRAADPCRDLPLEEAERRVAAGEPYVIRQRIPAEGVTTFHDAIFGDITVENSTLDDQVLMKRDGLPTYNFANVIDDHLMGITHVVRGSEYLSSAPKYDLLYHAFGWEVPTYVHCSPVMRDAQNKMSKRHGDPSYEDLKAQGYLTEAILNYVALLGWSPKGELAEQEIFDLEGLTRAFDITGISKSPAIFDRAKLDHFNAVYLRGMEPAAFAKVAEPYIRQAVRNPAYDAAAIAALLQARCERLTEIPEKVDFFDALPEYAVDFYTNKKSKTNPEVCARMLEAAIPMLEALPDWTDESIHDGLVNLAASLEVKNATLMWPVRIAAAGKLVTPGGAVEICRILGRDETLRRLRSGLGKLTAC